MNVYIPSRSRFERSLTLNELDNAYDTDKIFLVVPHDQKSEYKPLIKKHGVQLLPCPEKGIALTRQFIGEHAGPRFLMLDDDLRFNVRYEGPTSLTRAKTEDITHMLSMCNAKLKKYAHIAVSARQGNNVLPWPYAENKRPLRALGYQKQPFLDCEHGRVAIMEDFDVTLQLLRAGHKNCIITCYAQDHVTTNYPGGCSDYRTRELHDKNVKKMQKLHPDFISLVLKSNTSGSAIKAGLSERLEARIKWVKAYQSSQE